MTLAAYEALLAAASEDPAVEGLVLTGSRGRQGAPLHVGSDWDVRLIVGDDDLAGADDRYATGHGSPVDVVVFERSRFERAALPGAPDAWDRYSYVGVPLVIDKTDGALAKTIARKATLHAEEARTIASAALGDYVNSMYRSRTNGRLGLRLAAHLDAVESIGPLLTFVFATAGRVRPFHKWLAWDLERAALPGPAWDREHLLGRVARLAADGDVTAQASLFRDAEALARSSGLGSVIDGWEPDVAWLRESDSASAARA